MSTSNPAKENLLEFAKYYFIYLFCGLIHTRFSSDSWFGYYPWAGLCLGFLIASIFSALNCKTVWVAWVRFLIPLFVLYMFYYNAEEGNSFIDIGQANFGFGHFLLLLIVTSITVFLSVDIEPKVASEKETATTHSLQVSSDPQQAFSRIVGQDHVINPLIEIAKIARSGIRVGKSNAPHAVLLFLGPTGVGKTEAAHALAEAVYGTKSALIRFDMGQFSDSHQVNRFYGPPPGYVGCEEGGQLTRSVLKKPRSVVLLDEVEKAHPKIWDAFLPVFDEGYIVDGSTNKRVDMTNTLIVLTSNLLVDKTNLYNLSPHDLKEAIASTGAFRLELLGRINEILAFKPLSSEIKAEILKRRLDAALWGLAEQGISIDVKPEDIDLMVRDVEASKFGVRQIDDIVRKYLRGAIAGFKDDSSNEYFD